MKRREESLVKDIVTWNVQPMTMRGGGGGGRDAPGGGLPADMRNG